MNQSSEQTLDRLRDVTRSGLRSYAEANESYPASGDEGVDHAGLLAYKVGILYHIVREIADLLGVER